VGVGKSTYAASLCKLYSGVHLNLDDWIANLFVPDRPVPSSIDWYIERKSRCVEQIWKLACNLIDADTDAILELGLIQKASRQQIYDRVDDMDYKLTVHLLEAPIDIRRERVKKRNVEKGDTFSIEVPDAFFEMASTMWESPDDSECAGRDIRFITTDVT